ncbi:stress enhanced protein 1, chloroplastic [Cinnamomum micranthum f. kanehirae]|uniref:Stress enhanced protein 1, chloroplastic n=1 Tax=Cinnamomum micranthum f. kanehirae TaxID=337451 RepID=A0A443NWX0_9MAGN|nr:stress enhanced protein 1, chloroplastic [Cinnamomum micranthum f. kanehirae]
MTQALLSASLHLPLVRDVNPRKSSHARAQIPRTQIARITSSSFARGSPLFVQRTSSQRRSKSKAMSVSIRAEQSTKKQSSSLDVWLGRFAMVGFASAITVEIVTGKGLLENFGLTSPLPTVALAVTGLVGVLTAVFIFQSASKG